MNYKEKVIKLLDKFPAISPMDLVRLDKYYIEYLRELAKKAGIDPEKEYKWTNKLIGMYSAKGYACIGDALLILDTLKEIVGLLTTQKDFIVSGVRSVATTDEIDVLKCVHDVLTLNGNKEEGKE